MIFGLPESVGGRERRGPGVGGGTADGASAKKKTGARPGSATLWTLPPPHYKRSYEAIFVTHHEQAYFKGKER